jgi:hypothetical protein
MASKMTLKTPDMTFKKEGDIYEPLNIFEPDNKTVVGVYQGTLSKYDILIKYRQLDRSRRWSRIRTPKHIHWAVDLLLKMQADKAKIKKFLGFLIRVWNRTSPIRSQAQRKKILNIRRLLNAHKNKIKEYQDISKYGEYRIEFLILLAKLLMIQEKTNRRDAYMFKNLLHALKEGENIYKIVSIATHTGR